LHDEHSSQSVQSQGQTQPQPGQTSFSFEIKLSCNRFFVKVITII